MREIRSSGVVAVVTNLEKIGKTTAAAEASNAVVVVVVEKLRCYCRLACNGHY